MAVPAGVSSTHLDLFWSLSLLEESAPWNSKGALPYITSVHQLCQRATGEAYETWERDLDTVYL